MEEGAVLNQTIASGLNGMIYVFSGSIRVNDQLSVRKQPMPFGIGIKQQVSDGELALLSDGETVEITCDSPCDLLILAGPEIDEQIARYGPFVMNTREEIHQAVIDYQNGTFA